MTTLLLHALATNTLYHAEDSGETSVGYTDVRLTEEEGNLLTDHDGNILTAYAFGSGLLVLHASATNTLYHAEAS